MGFGQNADFLLDRILKLFQIRGEGMPVEQAVLQNPKFVTEGQNVLVNEGDNIRSSISSSSCTSCA